MYAKKDYIRNPSTYACGISRDLKCIADDLIIKCEEIIDALAKVEK